MNENSDCEAADELEQLLVDDHESGPWADKPRALRSVASKGAGVGASGPAAQPVRVSGMSGSGVSDSGVRGWGLRLAAADVLGALFLAGCALLLLATLVLAVLVRSGAGGDAPSAPPDIGVAPLAVLERHGQARAQRVWGKGPEFVDPDLVNGRLAERVAQFSALQASLQSGCGGYESFAAGGFVGDKRWSVLPAADFTHFPSSLAYAHLNASAQLAGVRRSVCRTALSTRPGATVSVERVGPFTGRGGMDWTSTGYMDVAGLQSELAGRSVSLVGGMLAPVHANGTVIGYPPLHIHHAHLYPFGNEKERHARIAGSFRDDHDVVFQSHGDSECLAELGGVACLYRELPEGQGHLLADDHSGLSTDWEVNDVRAAGSAPLPWYFDIVVVHHEGAPRLHNVTYRGLNNPCSFADKCTYSVPYDAAQGSLSWYNVSHGPRLGAGYMTRWQVHTHHTLADALFLFHGPAGTRFALEDALLRWRTQPLPLGCGGEPGAPALHDLQQAKEALHAHTARLGAALVCEMTRPSLRFDCPEGAPACVRHDKAARLNCLERLRIAEGDELLVVAFNLPKPEFAPPRGSQAFLAQNPFAKNTYAGLQHSIFRADFVADSDGAGDGPPSLFQYGCDYSYMRVRPSNISEHKAAMWEPSCGAGIEDPVALDAAIFAGCPANYSLLNSPTEARRG
jgi:hypothetical protein